MEKELKEQLIEELKDKKNLSELEIRDLIIDKVIDRTRNEIVETGIKNNLIRDLFNSICRYDIIQILLEDREVDEIMVNGANCIFYEKSGRIYRENKVFENDEHLENIIQTMVGKINRVVNQAKPIVDFRLEDGSRVNVVMKPVAIDGPILTIRKFNKDLLSMDDLLVNNSINQEAIDFLRDVVKCKYNIFISGGTSSGKTTFLNLLAGFIPMEERLITIEDSAELNIANISNLIRLETREGKSDGENEVDIRTLIKTALRMRPDRIVVGEVRGGEAFDMLTAMNTGHEGSMSTGHANSANDMLLRLLTMVLVGNDLREDIVKNLIKSGIDIVVHLRRQMDKRLVIGIYELNKSTPDLELIPIFERDLTGELVMRNLLSNREKLNVYGGY